MSSSVQFDVTSMFLMNVLLRFAYTSAQVSLLTFFYPIIRPKKGEEIKRPSNSAASKESKSMQSSISQTQFRYYYKLIGYYLSETMLFFGGKNNPLGKMLIKLSLAMYVINYYIIRLDFFTSRVMYAITLHNVVSCSALLIAIRPIQTIHNAILVQCKRIMYVVGLSLIGAYFFHVTFIAPFDKLRKSLQQRCKCEKELRGENGGDRNGRVKCETQG